MFCTRFLFVLFLSPTTGRELTCCFSTRHSVGQDHALTSEGNVKHPPARGSLVVAVGSGGCRNRDCSIVGPGAFESSKRVNEDGRLDRSGDDRSSDRFGDRFGVLVGLGLRRRRGKGTGEAPQARRIGSLHVRRCRRNDGPLWIEASLGVKRSERCLLQRIPFSPAKLGAYPRRI